MAYAPETIAPGSRLGGDRPQASRNRHRQAGRPILNPLLPGCSVAGDQGGSRLLAGGLVRRRCPECKLATPSEIANDSCRVLRAHRPAAILRAVAHAASVARW